MNVYVDFFKQSYSTHKSKIHYTAYQFDDNNFSLLFNTISMILQLFTKVKVYLNRGTMKKICKIKI